MYRKEHMIVTVFGKKKKKLTYLATQTANSYVTRGYTNYLMKFDEIAHSKPCCTIKMHQTRETEKT